MLIQSARQIPSSEITPEQTFLSRRKLIRDAGILGVTAGVWPMASSAGLQPDDELTPESIVTSYNNFYEFGTAKSDPVNHAHTLTTDPWSVEVSGIKAPPSALRSR